MNLLNSEIYNQLKELFDAQLVHPVELILFYQNESCDSCADTSQLLEEVSSISDKISLTTYDLHDQQELAEHFHVTLVPGLVITTGDAEEHVEYKLRFAGIPSGYEFSSLIQAILLVSKRDSGLKPQVREELKKLSHPVNLKVFVTPT